MTAGDLSGALGEADWGIASTRALRDPGSFWEDLGLRLLHPAQILIMEAIQWIGRPLSPTQLREVFEKKRPLALLAYHCRRLVELGVLMTLAWQVPVRGTIETFYTYAEVAPS
jgi:hypothetical protein